MRCLGVQIGSPTESRDHPAVVVNRVQVIPSFDPLENVVADIFQNSNTLGTLIVKFRMPLSATYRLHVIIDQLLAVNPSKIDSIFIQIYRLKIILFVTLIAGLIERRFMPSLAAWILRTDAKLSFA